SHLNAALVYKSRKAFMVKELCSPFELYTCSFSNQRFFPVALYGKRFWWGSHLLILTFLLCSFARVLFLGSTYKILDLSALCRQVHRMNPLSVKTVQTVVIRRMSFLSQACSVDCV
ncbi:hypothetical protein, partial [Vibrio genomosp. F10]|uniref:hypothetical protein n=1 Tax=Vibrio genomosp. F10 TaxID=723171 RepID=UPI0005857A51